MARSCTAEYRPDVYKQRVGGGKGNPLTTISRHLSDNMSKHGIYGALI